MENRKKLGTFIIKRTMNIGESVIGLVKRNCEHDFGYILNTGVYSNVNRNICIMARLEVRIGQNSTVMLNRLSRVYFLNQLKRIGLTEGELVWS